MKIEETGLLYKTNLLKKLILENPELPLLVFAGPEACPSDWSCNCTCSDVRAEIGEFLDAETDFMSYYDDAGMIYEDRIQFEEDYGDWLETYEREKFDGTDAEWDAEVEKRIGEFDPYWKKCIILRVDN